MLTSELPDEHTHTYQEKSTHTHHKESAHTHQEDSTHTLTRLSQERMSFKVGLSERAQNTRSQEGGGHVCGWFLHLGAEHIDHSGRRTQGGDERRERKPRPQWRVRASPVDVMAHARDESGQEHERVPVRRFSTCEAAHVAVGAAVALGGQPQHTHTQQGLSTHTSISTSSLACTPSSQVPSDGSSHPPAEATTAWFPE